MSISVPPQSLHTQKAPEQSVQDRYTVDQCGQALNDAMGNVAAAARGLHCDRSTLYDYIRRYPALAQIVTDARESLIDHAESALRVAVLERQGWAVCFTLKTLGKERGYVERIEQEHSGPGGGPVEFTINLAGPRAEALRAAHADDPRELPPPED